MTIQVVGAGLGRTGTHSLKIALEQLLGGRCYHMMEVFGLPEHVPMWTAAAEGNPPDWADMLKDFNAIVDWPGGSFWPELSAAFPDAPVLLSTRDSEGWFKSASSTIFQVLGSADDTSTAGSRMEVPDVDGFQRMVMTIFANRFTTDFLDHDAAIAAYERHNAEVRASVPADRLLEWSPGDGWEPLCERLGVAVPEEPFPHVNTTAEFREMAGFDS